jgi:hypothetical protein
MPIVVMPSTSGNAMVTGNDDTFARASIPPTDVPSSGGATILGNGDGVHFTRGCAALLPTAADEVPPLVTTMSILQFTENGWQLPPRTFVVLKAN